MPIDTVRDYLREIGRFPLLKHEQELELARKVQAARAIASIPTPTPEQQKIIAAGQKAKRTLIESNLRLVVSVAKKYQNRGLDFLDLLQEGAMGLEPAAEKFDPEKGWKFSTYAYWWIRQAITRAIAHQSRSIRLPIHVTEKLNKIKKASKQLSAELGRLPTRLELAAKLGISEQQLADLVRFRANPVSLDLLVGSDRDSCLGDLLPSNLPTPETYLKQTTQSEQIELLLSSLSEREREVIEHNFGLAVSPKSLVQIGKEFSITRQRVDQIRNKALSKLRKQKSLISGAV